MPKIKQQVPTMHPVSFFFLVECNRWGGGLKEGLSPLSFLFTNLFTFGCFEAEPQYNSGWPVAKDGLELLILSLLPTKCWVHRRVPQCQSSLCVCLFLTKGLLQTNHFSIYMKAKLPSTILLLVNDPQLSSIAAIMIINIPLNTGTI